MPLSLTNGSETALNLGMVKILRPMGARIAWDPQGLFGMTPPFPPETGAAVLDLRNHCIFAGSKDTLPLFFIPPEGWIGGKVEVRVEVGLRTLRRVRTRQYHIARTLTKP